MDVRISQGAARRSLFACASIAGLLLVSPGCQWFKSSVEEWWAPTRDGNELDDKLTKTIADSQPASPPAEPATEAPPAKAQESARPASAAAPATKGASDALAAALAKDAWGLNVSLPSASQAEPAFRWRNPALENTLRLPPPERPDLLPWLKDNDPVASANAAIILARWQHGDPTARLVASIRNADLRMPLRQAAVEALGNVPSPAAATALQQLLDQYGQFAGPAARAYVSELHADLLTALARQAPPDARPMWTAPFKSPDPLVRMTALQCWAQSTTPIPPAALELRGDSDMRVRIALVKTLGHRRDPRGYDYLRRSLDDFDLTVRLAAIAALGDLGTPEARVSLEKMQKHTGETLRAAAVEALAACKADAAVAASAGDKSWRVRLAVANGIKQDPDMAVRNARQVERMILTLVADKNLQVQQAAVSAVQSWPLEQAGPALFLALRDGGFQVRRLAAAQLAERWPPAAEFPVDGAAEARLAAVDKLQATWHVQFGALQQFQPPIVNEAPRATLARLEAQFRRQVAALAAVDADAASQAPAELATADLARLPGLIARLQDAALPKDEHRAAVQALRELGPAIIAPLEHMAVDDGQNLPDALFSDVLPTLGKEFAALDQLADSEAHRRWAAADKLVELTAERPLRPLAIERLATLMAAQKDVLVWQPIMNVVARDAREPAVRIVYMASSSESADVRRRACEYLELHPAAAHAATLLPLLEDPHTAVVAAAVRALGAGGGTTDTAPLAALLTRTDKHLRLDAATALVRLGSTEGAAALERLAADADPDLRRSTATAMGQLADPVFVPTLITMLDDRHDVARAALDSLAAAAGKDISAARPEDESPPTVAERIRRWQRWFAETR